MPEPVLPAEPAWRLRRKQRRWRKRRSPEVSTDGGTRQDEAPDGLRVAMPPPPPEVTDAKRRKRRRRILLFSILGISLSAGAIGLRMAYRAYRRRMYGGVEPIRIDDAHQLGGLARRHGQVRRLLRSAFQQPGDAEATRIAVDEGGTLLRDMTAAEAFPGRRAWLANDLAWLKLTTPLPGFRDTAGALELAERAVAESRRKHPAYLDTYAEALFQLDRLEDALRASRAAIELAPKWKSLRATLEKIEAALRPGEP